MRSRITWKRPRAEPDRAPVMRPADPFASSSLPWLGSVSCVSGSCGLTDSDDEQITDRRIIAGP